MLKSQRWAIYILSYMRNFLISWYVLVPAMVGLGIATGVFVFAFMTPGRPNIGVIDVPYTVINDDTSYAISQFLDYARRDDSIKAVVIKLSSPGGGAAASERLYIETRRLREEKPVVLVMGGLVASGGYMMSMGTSYTYAQTSSLVGNVGVISVAGPLIPILPDESVVFSSPNKLYGGSRREWDAALDLLKSAFVQMVVSERGDRLRISGDEIGEGRLYSGMVAVRLGLADELGSETDAIRKAADLAKISNYGFVDVNLEVLREFVQSLDFILSAQGGNIGLAERLSFPPSPRDDGETLPSVGESESGITGLQSLRASILNWGLGTDEEDPLPGFPLDIHRPNIYYIYSGYAP